jgi:DNA-binding transcriptional MerR regulator
MEKPIEFPFYRQDFNPMAKVDLVAAKDFLEKLHERKFFLRDVGISSRLFNQWKNYGLIDNPGINENRKWVILSFGDLLWLGIIQDLRKLGVPLEDILRIKSRIQKDMTAEMLGSENGKLLHDTLLKIAESKQALNEAQLDKFRKDLLARPVANVFKELLPRPMNLWEGMIYNMVTVRSESYLILFLTDYFEGVEPQNLPALKTKKEGKRKKTPRKTSIECIPFSHEWKYMDHGKIDMGKFLEVPHIKIPINVYIRDFISNNKYESQLPELGLLTKEECILLSAVRKANVKEITINFRIPDNSGEVRKERIEVTKALKKEAEARLIDTFTKDEYAEIIYKASDGKVVNFKKTLRVKL